MNATLTWWGVSVAIRNHQTLGAAVVGQDMVLMVVPIFVAVMVWVIRVLIIGTFSIAGERIFSMADDRPAFGGFRSKQSTGFCRRSSAHRFPLPCLARHRHLLCPFAHAAGAFRAETRFIHRPESASRLEPTYHPMGMAASPKDDAMTIRR